MNTKARWLRCTRCGHEFISAPDAGSPVFGIFTSKVTASCPSCGKISECIVIRSARDGHK